jgi:hypothetical protein
VGIPESDEDCTFMSVSSPGPTQRNGSKKCGVPMGRVSRDRETVGKRTEDRGHKCLSTLWIKSNGFGFSDNRIAIKK